MEMTASEQIMILIILKEHDGVGGTWFPLMQKGKREVVEGELEVLSSKKMAVKHLNRLFSEKQ